MAISISWYPVTKSPVIHFNACTDTASSPKYLFYFALYSLLLFIQCIGIFGGICNGKLGNITFDNQPGQHPFKTTKLQGFRGLDITEETFQFYFSIAICFALQRLATQINNEFQSDCKLYNRGRKISKKC